MGGYETELCSAQPNPNRRWLDDLYAVEANPAVAPEFAECTQEPGGAAAERFAVQGQQRARVIVAQLTPAEYLFSLAYDLRRFLNSTATTSGMTETERAQAFLQGVNEILRARNLRAEFAAGEPPRLLLRQVGSDLPAQEAQLPATLATEGDEAVRLANGLAMRLGRDRRQNITDETLRTTLETAISEVFPERPGEDRALRAQRIQRMMPILNQVLHAAGYHMEVGNDCAMRLYVWDRTGAPPGRRGDLITNPPLSLYPQNDASDRLTQSVNIILASPSLRDAAAVRAMDNPAQQALADLIWGQLRERGRPMIDALNQRLHARGLHIVIPPPGERAGRHELEIYTWIAGPPPRQGERILEPVRMDETIDVAMQFGTQREAFDGARAIGYFLRDFARNNEAPNEMTIQDVADFFWRRMKRVEDLMDGRTLTERRQDFFNNMRIALRTQGLDIEYDPNRPNNMRIFRWVNGARQGDGIAVNRPDYFPARQEVDPAVPGGQQPLVSPENQTFWRDLGLGLAALWLGRRAYNRLRRWWAGDTATTARPPGTDVDVSRVRWEDLQRPMDDMRRLLGERGGFTEGGAINRNAFDPRVLGMIDHALAEAQAGRLTWSQAELQAMREFRTAYDALRTGGTPTAEMQAMHMILETSRNPFQRTAVDYYNMSPDALRAQTDGIRNAYARRTVTGGLSSDAVLTNFASQFRTRSNTIFAATGEGSFGTARARADLLQRMVREFVGPESGLQLGVNANQVSIEVAPNGVDGTGRQVVRHPGNAANPPIEGALVGRTGDTVQIRLANGNVVSRPVGEIHIVIQLPETHLNHATGLTAEGANVHSRMTANDLASTIYRFLAQTDAILNGRAPSGATPETIALSSEAVARRLQLELNAGRLTPMQNLGPTRVNGVELARVVTTPGARGVLHMSVQNGVVRFELVDGSSRRALTDEETRRMEAEQRAYHERLYAESIRMWRERSQNERLSPEDRAEAQRVHDALVADLQNYQTNPERRAEVHMNLPQELARPTPRGWRTALARGAAGVSGLAILLILADQARSMLPTSPSGGIPVLPVTGGPGG